MQLSEIRDNVRLRAGFSPSDQMFSDSVIDTFINASLRRVSTQYMWPWLEARATFTTTKGESDIPAPIGEGIRKMRWVNHEDHNIPFRNYRDVTDYFGYEGRPVFHTEEGGVFSLLPTPDAAYDIEYGYIIDTEPELTTDTDVPLIPDYAIDLLISDVCVLLARRDRDRDLEKVFYAEYRNTLNRLKDELIETTEGMLPRRTRRY